MRGTAGGLLVPIPKLIDRGTAGGLPVPIPKLIDRGSAGGLPVPIPINRGFFYQGVLPAEGTANSPVPKLLRTADLPV